MKRLVMFLALALLTLGATLASADNLQPYRMMVDKADAVQAMALANKWKWTENRIKTYVTPREVIFEFPGKIVKKVPLPDDKMVVAIAPYLTYTHG